MSQKPPAESQGLSRILADVSGFAGSQYFVRLSSLVKGFVVARVLGPEGNGLWQHFVIISEYCQYGHLGSLPGLNKVLGHRVGRGEADGALVARETGTGAVFFSALTLWAVLVAWVIGRGDALSAWDRWGLPILGFVVVMDQVNHTYMALLRTYSRIHIISAVATVYAAANLALSLALLPKHGILGLLVAWAVTRAATTIWLVRSSGFGFRPRVHWPTLRILVATGFPIYLFHLTRVGLSNIDRVLVDSVLAKSDLGIYGIAVTIVGLVRYAAEAVGFVIYPIFLRTFGETKDPKSLAEHLVKPTELLALLVPLALGLAYLWLHLPILWLLPAYEASVDIYRLLTVNMTFACLAILPGFFLMAIDRQNWLVPMGLAVIAFDWFVGRAAIGRGLGLEGVALTMGLGSFTYCTAVLGYASRFALGSTGKRLAWIAQVYLPVAWVAAVIGLLHLVIPRTPLAAWNEAARASVEGAIFVVVTAPLLVAFERRRGLLRHLKRARSSGPRPPRS